MYPNRKDLEKSGEELSWIEAGASAFRDDSTLVASFSNYGKQSVDVFAPGVHLISTFPGSRYEDATGTSIAAPVVAGLAALIIEYYPKLSALQVKEIIMNSFVKVEHPVDVNKDGLRQLVKLSEVRYSWLREDFDLKSSGNIFTEKLNTNTIQHKSVKYFYLKLFRPRFIITCIFNLQSFRS